MDYIACGYPDLSYHGQNAWQPQTEGSYRHIGIMLCGKYAKAGEGDDDSFLYLAMNMDWVSQELALPKLPKGMEWSAAFSTGEPETDSGQEESTGLLNHCGLCQQRQGDGRSNEHLTKNMGAARYTRLLHMIP